MSEGRDRVRSQATYEERMARYHHTHGATPASWATVGIMFVGTVVGALGVVFLDWWLGIAGVALLVVGAVVGKVMAATGHGKPLSFVHPDAEDVSDGMTAPSGPEKTG